MNYLNELNEVQRQAALHNQGAALVIAVPGAGKTRVLTYRIAQLMQNGVNPQHILALTFTNKSAKEMKERIVKVVGKTAHEVWAGTFHSIFARILRREAEKIGFPNDFSIYDTNDSKSLIGDIVKGQGLDPKLYTSNNVFHRISNAKNNLISPEKYKSSSETVGNDAASKIPYVYKLYDLYMQRCQKSAAMDFDDLLYRMHELLSQNKAALDYYRDKFRYILVDEFQDTNPLQYAIIQLLVKYPNSPENIFIVGDDAQSIYGFRGATVQNILDFERDYPALKVFKLEQNYRSTSYIVGAANDVIIHNKKQFKKTIRSERGEGEPIKLIRAITETDEAKHVAQEILVQKNQNQLKYEDFAVLYRTNAQSRVFEEILNSHRIPYKIYGGMSFYERKEVKDALAYLRVIVNPLDEEALKRIINYPTRGIGEKTMEILKKEAEKQELSLWLILKQASKLNNNLMFLGSDSTNLAPSLWDAPSEPIKQHPSIKYIKHFVEMIEMFRLRLLDSNAHELAVYVMKISGMWDELKSEQTAEAKERAENLQELLDGIKSFVENDEMSTITSAPDKSLTSYLQNVLLLTDIEDDKTNTDRIKLMSVHYSKGLEFKSVFVIGLEEGIFPSAMVLNGKDARAGLDEERRLFYVAITRAELHLTLTYASSRTRFGKIEYNNNSRFIQEISPDWLGQNTATSTVKGLGVRKKDAVGFVQKNNSSPSNNSPIANFKASPNEKIAAGQKIQHERFGIGKIIATEGSFDNKVAIILFEQGVGEKRIMLKFAKLMIL